jgi:anti-sigma B factor antagonist
MKIQVNMHGDVVSVSPEGDIKLGEGDLALRDTIHKQIESGRNKIVLNLSTVRFMDSAGLGEVVACLKRVREAGGDLKLAGLNQRITDLFTLTKLISIFDTHDDEPTAVSAFR